MALTKYKRERLDVPHEPGEWIEIKARLSHWDMTCALDAKRAKEEEAMVRAAQGLTAVQGALDSLMADPEMKAQFEAGAREKRASTSAEASGIEAYDEYVLFERAIVAWSYKDDAGADAEVSAETVRDLDPETVEWLKGEVAARNIIGPQQGEDSAASSQGSSSLAA